MKILRNSISNLFWNSDYQTYSVLRLLVKLSTTDLLNIGEGMMYLPMLGLPETVEEQQMRRESLFGVNERDFNQHVCGKRPQ